MQKLLTQIIVLTAQQIIDSRPRPQVIIKLMPVLKQAELLALIWAYLFTKTEAAYQQIEATFTNREDICKMFPI